MLNADNLMSKVVVFDLDETLGYFTEFGIFYELLIKYLKISKQYRTHVFCSLLDQYPEVLRPNIWTVFKYLKTKKKKGICSQVMIYTNNQSPKEWTEMIKHYIETRLEYKLFDKIIGAFKINGVIREVCRTTNDKTTSDLVRCARLPEKTQICFIDDTYFESMDNVYYIKVNHYVHNISINVMVNRFLNSRLSNKYGIKYNNQEQFLNYVRNNITHYKYTYKPKNPDEYDIDKIVTKQLLVLLQDFFEI